MHGSTHKNKGFFFNQIQSHNSRNHADYSAE